MDVMGDDTVAAAAGQTGDVPVVEHVEFGHRDGRPQQIRWAAPGVRDSGQQVPVGVLAAGGERRGSVDHVTAVHRTGPRLRYEGAADPYVGAGEDLVLRLVREERRDERAPALDQRHEPRRPARGGDLAQYVDLRTHRALVTAVSAGHVHAGDPGVRESRDDLAGHPAFLFGAQGVRTDERLEFPYTFDEVGVRSRCG